MPFRTGWAWMPGMATTCGIRVVRGTKNSLEGYRAADPGVLIEAHWPVYGPCPYVPDLEDPATAGCVDTLDLEALETGIMIYNPNARIRIGIHR